MNALLKKLKDVRSTCCVTVTMKTHRTRPENEKDEIRLRSMLQDLEKRLHDDYEVRFARELMENMQKVADDIDHNYNQEGLVLFANDEGIAEYARLPFEVENRIVVDPTFATRPLVRASHQDAAYYILVLSREKARLIQAYNDKVSREVGDVFPMEKKLFAESNHKASMADGSDRLIEEFFNRVDKEVMKELHQHPLPLVIVTEKRNYYHYRKMADKREVIIGHLNKNRMDEKADQLTSDAWPIVKEYSEKKNDERVEELKKAVGANQFLSDFNDIWMALRMGRGRTLFVQEGLFQPAIINDEGRLDLVDEERTTEKGVIDDIIDDMIEENLRYGGDNVFLSGDELEDFQGLALVTRY